MMACHAIYGTHSMRVKILKLMSHSWVFCCHLDAVGCPPLVLFIDRHPSLISSATITMPLTDQVYCLQHLNSNIAQHLWPALGGDWEAFMSEFWAVYRAVSPADFDSKWADLLCCFPIPSVVQYLEEEIYPCRDRWGWAWISTRFTAGIQTNGQPEVENCITKALSGPKMTLFQVFKALVQCSEDQKSDELVQTRQVRSLQALLCFLADLLFSLLTANIRLKFSRCLTQ